MIILNRVIAVVHWWLKWRVDGHWLESCLLVTLVPSGVNQEFITELLIPQIGLAIPLTRDWCSNAIKTFPRQCIIIRKSIKIVHVLIIGTEDWLLIIKVHKCVIGKRHQTGNYFSLIWINSKDIIANAKLFGLQLVASF